MKLRVCGRQNRENSSTLDNDCGKSIYLSFLIFLVVLDIGHVHPKQLLYFIYHKNSKNAAKPRIQPFLDQKLKKMLKSSRNRRITPGPPYNRKTRLVA